MRFSNAQLDHLRSKVKVAQIQSTGQVHSHWRDLYDYYYGAAQVSKIDFSKAPWLKDEFRIANLTYAAVQHVVPLLLDSAPEWYMLDERGMLADGPTDYMRAFYQRRHIRRELRPVFKDSLIIGTGVLKAGYDPNFDEYGDVRVTWQDPFCVFPDPAATRIEQAEFVAILNEYSPAYAERVFSGKEDTPFKKIDLEKAEPASPENPTRPASVRMHFDPDVKHVNVWEVYHDFGATLTIYSGDQVLYHGENPLGARWPLVFFQANAEKRNPWANSEIEQYIPLQDTVNLLRMRFNATARLHASPTTVVHGNPTTGDVTNTPGEVVGFSTPDGGLAKIPGPEIPQYLYAMYTQTLHDLDVVSGVHNVTRGQRPQGVQAGVAIQALQEASQTRPRDMAREYQDAFEELGQLIWDIGQANYNEPRMLPYIARGQTYVGRVTMQDLYSQTGPKGEILEWSNARPAKYRCVVSVGGERPLSPVARAEEALLLFERGAIDQEALLDALNFPGRTQVIQRMHEKEAAMLQMQAMAAGQQAQGAGAGAPGAPQAGGMGMDGAQALPMEPSEAVAFLQQSLQPQELAVLSMIREKVVMQGQIDDQEMMFLDELLSRGDDIAAAVDTFLRVQPEDEDMQAEQQALTEQTQLM